MTTATRKKKGPARTGPSADESGESGSDNGTLPPPPAEVQAPADSPREPGEFRLVLAARIEESATNPRKVFKGLEELARSIKTHGVLEPLLVRPAGHWHVEAGRSGGKDGFFVLDRRKIRDGRYDGDMAALGFFKTFEQAELARPLFELVAGARRFRAARQAGLAKVPAIVRDLSDRDALEIQVIENDQREDVQPLDQARGYQALIETAGYDVPSLAAKIGRGESYVYQRLQLTRLIAPFQEWLEGEKIHLGHAVLLARLTGADQERMAKDYAFQNIDYSGAPPVKRLREKIEQEFHLNLKSAPFPKDDAALLAEAGACVTCPKRTGNNPTLWPDVAKEDTCTDPACYRAKERAFVQVQVRRAQAKDPGVLRISASSYQDKKGVLGRGSYEIVPAKEARKAKEGELKTAVVVEGDKFGDKFGGEKAGRVVQVRVRGQDKEGGDTHADRWKKEEEARRRKADRLKAVHAAAAEKILAGFQGPTAADWLPVAGVVWKAVDSHARAAACGRRDWPAPVGWGAGLPAAAAELGPGELARLMFELWLVDAARVDSFQPRTSGEFAAAAGRFGLDLAAIAADLKGKEKEAARAEKAKASPKGKRSKAHASEEASDDDEEASDAEEDSDAASVEAPLPTRARFHKFDDDVAEILRTRLSIEGNHVTIAGPRLDRGLYERVNKTLIKLGGKWKGGKVQAHVFDADPAAAIAAALGDGKVLDRKRSFQFFETPRELAERMVRLAEIGPGMSVLEPSAGLGAIADAVRDAHPTAVVECVELDDDKARRLARKGYTVSGVDFTTWGILPGSRLEFDRILMNPPFAGGQDADHLRHAFELLKPGGRLVAIVSAGPWYRTDRKSAEFQAWYGGDGHLVTVEEDVPAGTFRESGTEVAAKLLVIEKSPDLAGAIERAVSDIPAGGKCRVCGCTEGDCRACAERTGEPCTWAERDLCSACVDVERLRKERAAELGLVGKDALTAAQYAVLWAGVEDLYMADSDAGPRPEAPVDAAAAAALVKLGLLRKTRGGYCPTEKGQYVAGDPAASWVAGSEDRERAERNAPAPGGPKGGLPELPTRIHAPEPIAAASVGLAPEDLEGCFSGPDDLSGGRVRKVLYLHGQVPHACTGWLRPDCSATGGTEYHLRPLVPLDQFVGEVRAYSPAGDLEGVELTAPGGRHYVAGPKGNVVSVYVPAPEQQADADVAAVKKDKAARKARAAMAR